MCVTQCFQLLLFPYCFVIQLVHRHRTDYELLVVENVCCLHGSVKSTTFNVPQNKIQIYEEWVKRLLEEISTLVDCIQEMENQTAQGLDVLTTNLNRTCLPDDRIRALQNDLNAVVEIIRRARAFGQWNTDGIELKVLSFSDVFGEQKL